MARRKRSRKREGPVEKDLLTESIVAAFEAAFRLYREWESPDGPAVVRDVSCAVGGGWWITYRVISQ